MKRWIAGVLLFVAVAGGYTACKSTGGRALDKAQYVSYQGSQQAWPTSSTQKTIVSKRGMIIYCSLPPRPYEIMGLIHVAQGERTVRKAAEAAQAAGANAILVCADEAFIKAGITTPLGMTATNLRERNVSALTGLLIRWKL